MRNDPAEIQNLADDLAYREDAARLMAALALWAEETQDEYLHFDPEPAPVRRPRGGPENRARLAR